jgi:hypothetical protein
MSAHTRRWSETEAGPARIIHRLVCRTRGARLRRHLLRRPPRQTAQGSPAGASAQSDAEFARGSGHAILRW